MDQGFEWIFNACIVPTLQQGALISTPMLLSGIVVRLCILLGLSSSFIHALVAVMGICLLWYFYSSGIVYFIVLCGIVYAVLLALRRNKGISIGIVSVAFLIVW